MEYNNISFEYIGDNVRQSLPWMRLKIPKNTMDKNVFVCILTRIAAD